MHGQNHIKFGLLKSIDVSEFHKCKLNML